MRLLVLLLFFALSSCATHKISTLPAPSDRMFPNGDYEQHVDLTIQAKGDQKEKSFSFTGIVRLKPETIEVVVLGYFGITAFKINENIPTREIKTEIYLEPIRKFEPRLKEYYLILRELLIAGKTQPGTGSHLKWLKANDKGFPVELQTVGLAQDALFKMREFDSNGVPKGFSITHPNFSVEVEVTHYDI